MSDFFTVVFDTNALISAAILKQSVSSKAFDAAFQSHRILYSVETLLELIDVIFRKKFDKYLDDEGKNLFLNNLLTIAHNCEVTSTITDCRDPKDNKFLELAIDGKADYIITGDQDLLVLHPYKNVQIVTPAQFLDNVTSNET